ncbi:hypothetical protein ACOSQ2_012123 [Xanthoceras sorbifolium]
MQTVKLPSELCYKLDKLNRTFLWGHMSDRRTVHLVDWATVCSPKSLGGLGIKSMKLMNQSLLAKAGWRLLQGEKGTWSRLISCRYLNHMSLMHAKEQKNGQCSHIWKGIKFGAKLLFDGTVWRVGDGKTVRFCTDVWMGDCGPLVSHAIIAVNETMLRELVQDYVKNASWDMEKLALVLPWSIIHQIAKVHVGRNSDRLIWGGSAGGIFSVKTAYNIGLSSSSSIPWQWSFLWGLKLPTKIITFLWSLLHGKILTNEHRMARCLTDDDSCPRCSSGIESMDHLLRGCKDSIFVWEHVCAGSSKAMNFSGNISTWLITNLKNSARTIDGVHWFIIFTLTLWYIWKWRVL